MLSYRARILEVHGHKNKSLPSISDNRKLLLEDNSFFCHPSVIMVMCHLMYPAIV